MTSAGLGHDICNKHGIGHTLMTEALPCVPSNNASMCWTGPLSTNVALFHAWGTLPQRGGGVTPILSPPLPLSKQVPGGGYVHGVAASTYMWWGDHLLRGGGVLVARDGAVVQGTGGGMASGATVSSGG